MPRIARASVGGICYHVINRGNARQDVFLEDDDYAAFLRAMEHACTATPMRVLGFCLMPNHFHLTLWPFNNGDLSKWMHWVQNTHIRRYHRVNGTSGHIWQGRFKAFPIEDDDHLLTVLRYIERNPVRARMVRRAENWHWSSARFWQAEEGRPAFLDTGPVRRPPDWLPWLNQAVTAGEVDAVRRSVLRGTPFGSASWTEKTVVQLGLQSTMRPRGRPRKQATNEGGQ